MSTTQTALVDVLVQKKKLNPQCILHRRKEALCRGRNVLWGNLKRFNKKPKIYFKGFGCTVYCLVDTSGTLADMECYLVSDGRVLLGQCTAYRSPMVLPSDTEVMTCVAPPEGMMLEDNCLIFSAKGYGNSNMAGGDYDGDLAMVVFNESLVKLVQLISEAIPSYGLGGELKKKLKEELGEMVPLSSDAADGFPKELAFIISSDFRCAT